MGNQRARIAKEPSVPVWRAGGFDDGTTKRSAVIAAAHAGPASAVIEIARRASRSSRAEYWVAVAMGVGTLAVLWAQIDRGWVPLDDGMLAQIADRIRDGQRPFVDFDDPYTGALGYINAAAMTIAGESLIAIRYPLIGLGLVIWVLVFAIARRWERALIAATVASSSVAFSVLLFPTPMPTWYTLAGSLAGVWAFIRWSETSRPSWLFISGLFIGVACLIKLTAAFVFGALVIGLAVRQQRRTKSWTVLLAFSPAVIAATILLTRPTLETLVFFLGPVSLTVVMALLIQRRDEAEVDGPLASRTDALALFAGASLPVVLWVGLFALFGSVARLVEGAVLIPAMRLEVAAAEALHPRFLLLPCLVLALVAFAQRVDLARVVGAMLLLAPIVGVSGSWRTTYIGTMIMLAYAALLAAAVCLRSISVQKASKNAVLIVAAAIYFGLVAFPFFAGTYVLYAVPLSVLALFVAASEHSAKSVFLVTMGLAGLAIFGVTLTATNRIHAGEGVGDAAGTTVLASDRSGLRIPIEDSIYDRLLQLIDQHAGDGPIYAGPDLPEVYFLANRESVTPAVYEILSRRFDYETLWAQLDVVGANLIVLNLRDGSGRGLSPMPTPEQLAKVRETYPHSEMVGGFEVRWRGSGGLRA